ncbi:MAG: CusA/CzcA family heavy metal efflux RND transporter [Cyclobacteriaceae bacterium]|nr:CusA/CzcA family heavy metal efflux RND transporter [Cyclobacteriaceae bacterium]
MLNSIIQFSIRNKLIVGLFIVALIGWGSYSVTQLPIDAVPDITNNQVQVLTIAPSQSALDIERLVTFPVEQTMATIPGIQEIRSFSRFGLSVVTIVFTDATDVYWARQQVSERLTDAKKQIPPGVGTPELAPMTTGLGEIYQYIVKAKPGYEDTYSVMELRTIQDWIVRRQLLGTKGVAEVSSFGGYLKQFEIALSPEKLRSLNLSITEVMAALENNNQNTGGAYIEKNTSAYFIRSEGLITSIDDIGNIIVRSSTSGMPLLMRDVSTIKLGNAIRFGAMTQNGKGETVGAVVMMLKGANSSQVIANVKERVAVIEKTLPEGVTIEPFLDRTKLVNNAIETVTRNLAEGALIVIFVLVLLLGNLRAGLVVASVIPLAMLFAIIMMNLFGVSGNLMSLGAIDFGLIVDGAVIIVEATLHYIAISGVTGRLSQDQMDEQVGSSAKKMMNAAAFGQIIILIVYLPILSLVGIEGKMFKPMAQTVIFAIIGAFILSLTYVPLASALFLSKATSHKKTISDKIIAGIQKVYTPALLLALRKRTVVMVTAAVMLAASLFIFSRMGGEFLPELDEGDFAVDTRLLTGTNLTSTVQATLKGEEVLLKNFPEIEKVIAKIGSAEIPTDPMPIEAADMMVVMKDKSQWVSAKTKDEMIAKMQKALSENVPGVWFGFQHPIQMRFNELMTGARQDVVVKVYGENLDELTAYASHIGKLANAIQGTESLFIENMTGLPQIIIRLKREQLARFNLTVKQVNQVINASMAGQSAGLVFEGEKRFDVVVRLDNQSRKSIDDIRNLYIPSVNGTQIPLSQVADVTLEVGPNQIQRDDAKRRIVVGFNTRGRDVESIVTELQGKVKSDVKFAPGYYVTYGGTFKNLQEAKARLLIAVPVSLVLIFVLLYFTFHSVKQGLLIYTAIPLSAIGGVFALWLRGMPFSISAGIGFIALFGVAVLNGIVLIAEFNRLKEEGLTNLMDIIMKGTATRLRPVIMTATVASLGFLPMALSHGSGAEVQKPLATVVIGGLLTATLLTLIVLPVLYMVTENFSIRSLKPKSIVVMLIFMLVGWGSQSQAQIVTMDEAVKLALEKNPSIQSAMLETSRQTVLKSTAFEIAKTDVSLMYGQYNSIEKGDNNLTISQTIPFPTLFVKQNGLNKAMITAAALKENVSKNDLTFQVRQVFNQLLYLKLRNRSLLQQDSLLTDLLHIATVQFKTGAGTLLTTTSAETQLFEIQNMRTRNEADIQIALNHLQLLCQTSTVSDVQGDLETLMVTPEMPSEGFNQNPSFAFSKQQIELANWQKKVEVSRMLPDLRFGYFNQTLIGIQNVGGQDQYFGSSKRFQGFQVGLLVPLWFGPHRARIKSTAIAVNIARKQNETVQLSLTQQYNQAVQELRKNQNSLDYYKNSALKTADLLISQSRLAFRSGEIDHTILLLNLRQALAIREGYFIAMQQYNQSIIIIDFLNGKI